VSLHLYRIRDKIGRHSGADLIFTAKLWLNL
jgi:hypothetical protein